MPHYLLTVVITAYNQPEEIAQLLGGIKSVPEGVEILVVDDNSNSDEQFATMQAVSDFNARTGAGRYEYTSINLGCGDARNYGIGNSNSEWVWFVDGDDRIANGALEKIVAALGRSRSNVLAVSYEIVKEDGRRELVTASPGTLPWEWSITAWSKILRRSIVLPFQARFVEDNDWWYRTCIEWYRTCIELTTVPLMDVLDEVCYEYHKLAAGSVTSIFERIWANSRAPKPMPLRELVQAMGSDAWVVGAMLEMMGRLVKVRVEALDRKVPGSLLSAIDFTIDYFANAVG